MRLSWFCCNLLDQNYPKLLVVTFCLGGGSASSVQFLENPDYLVTRCQLLLSKLASSLSSYLNGYSLGLFYILFKISLCRCCLIVRTFYKRRRLLNEIEKVSSIHGMVCGHSYTSFCNTPRRLKKDSLTFLK